MLGMQYCSVSELERYFANELRKKEAMLRLVARMEKEIR